MRCANGLIAAATGGSESDCRQDQGLQGNGVAPTGCSAAPAMGTGEGISRKKAMRSWPLLPTIASLVLHNGPILETGGMASIFTATPHAQSESAPAPPQG